MEARVTMVTDFDNLCGFTPPPDTCNSHAAAVKAADDRYAKGRYKWNGLTLVIEHPKGSTRSGTSKAGKAWSTVMKDHYGYFAGKESGADEDEIDFFLSEASPDSELVFVVNQVDKGGRFDEHKCILGCTTEAEARAAYLRNYQAGWDGLGSIRPMTLPDFKAWLATTPEKAAHAEEDAKNVFEDYVPHLLLVKRAADDDAARPFTIAVDFDGTLAEQEEPFDPESAGPPRARAVHWVRLFHERGARIIIFTVRGDTGVVEKWLAEHDVPYDHINENPDQPPDSSGKVFADVYIDDRAVDGRDPDTYGPEVLRRMRGTDEESAKLMIVRREVLIVGPESLLSGLEEGNDEDRETIDRF